jgi:hypothetical protein
LGIHDRNTFNLLIVFEQLRKLFPKLEIRVVPDSELIGREARAYPRLWLIKIRQGVYEGLLRGDFRSRWTFAHELGHVVLEHPGNPNRNCLPEDCSPMVRLAASKSRTSANDTLIEAQADIFAAEFLAPTDLASECTCPEQIGAVFQLSGYASRRRFLEIALEKASRSFGTKKSLEASTAEIVQLEDHAAIIYRAIASTIFERSASSSLLLEPLGNSFFNASILSAKTAELLLWAYERDSTPSSRDKFTVAASLAIAALTLKPIREISSSSSGGSEILKINQICALKICASFLNIDIRDLERRFANKDDDGPALSFGSNYLESFIRGVDKLVRPPFKILHCWELPSHVDYSRKQDICGVETRQLEVIARVFALSSNTR